MLTWLCVLGLLCRRSHGFLPTPVAVRSLRPHTAGEKLSRAVPSMSAEAAKPKNDVQIPKDVGEMELFCKAGPNGNTLGDCPFTHYVSMALHVKNVPFKVTPCAPDNKPKWLVDEFEGKMPCLVHKGEAYTESSTIVKYLEFFFPEPSLAPAELKADIEAATSVTNGLFGVLAKYLKNVNDKEADKVMLAAVQSELKDVDEHLQKTGGPYLCGKQLTLVDCSFAPKLYHAKVGLAQFKNVIISPDLEALNGYMSTIFSYPAFEASTYSPTTVVAGWNQARGTAAQ